MVSQKLRRDKIIGVVHESIDKLANRNIELARTIAACFQNHEKNRKKKSKSRKAIDVFLSMTAIHITFMEYLNIAEQPFSSLGGSLLENIKQLLDYWPIG